MPKIHNIPTELRDSAVSKKLRFDVFERDGFACQYCGATPPDALLECDHIQALAKGGRTTIDNLITACEGCNRGKSDRELGHIAIRPDADLMYLKTMQEVAELQRYQSAVDLKERILSDICDGLCCRAYDLTGDRWSPTPKVLLQLLAKYSPEVAYEAVSVVAQKVDSGEISTHSSRWVPLIWGVAKRVDHQMEGQ